MISITTTHIPSGEVTRTLVPFETLHAARATVVESVGQVLIWERQSTGAFVAEKYSLLWLVEARPDLGPPGSHLRA